MEAQLTNSATDTRNGGKSTRRGRKKATVPVSSPKGRAKNPVAKTQEEIELERVDQWAILLTQVKHCREAGLKMNWIRMRESGTVALVASDAKLCENNHLYVSATCPYCKSEPKAEPEAESVAA